MPENLKLFEICAFPAMETGDTFVGCQITSSLLRSLAVSGGFWGVWGLSGVENMLLWTSSLMHHVIQQKPYLTEIHLSRAGSASLVVWVVSVVGLDDASSARAGALQRLPVWGFMKK